MSIESDIRQAYFANLRDHQIGEGDGMSSDVAEDLGFSSSEEVQNLIENLNPRQEKAAIAVGRVVCGDCAQVMPCPHGDGKRTFGH